MTDAGKDEGMVRLSCRICLAQVPNMDSHLRWHAEQRKR